jgi:hypothetical protein
MLRKPSFFGFSNSTNDFFSPTLVKRYKEIAENNIKYHDILIVGSLDELHIILFQAIKQHWVLQEIPSSWKKIKIYQVDKSA